MAQGLQQLVAAPAAPQLSPGQAPGAEDDPLRRQGLLRRGDGEAPLRLPDACDLKAGADGDARLIQGKAQYVHHAPRLIREGVDPAAVLRHREKAQTTEEIQGRFRVEAGEGVRREVRGGTVVVGRREAEVRQIAAAVAGGQEFTPYPGLPLQERHSVPPLPGGQRRHHPGGPAADDQNFHVASPFGIELRFLDYSRGSSPAEGEFFTPNAGSGKRTRPGGQGGGRITARGTGIER